MIAFLLVLDDRIYTSTGWKNVKRRKCMEADSMTEALSKASAICCTVACLKIEDIVFASGDNRIDVYADGIDMQGDSFSERYIGYIKEDIA